MQEPPPSKNVMAYNMTRCGQPTITLGTFFSKSSEVLGRPTDNRLALRSNLR
jgi:hypothetical protein